MSRLPAIDPEHPDQAELIIRRLSKYAELGLDETELLRSLSETPERLAAGTELIAEGERLEHPRLLLGRLGLPAALPLGWSTTDLRLHPAG